MRVSWISVALVLGVSCGGKPAAPVAAVPPPSEWVDGPHGRLRVDDGGRGAGIPVVFVHGLAADHHVWDQALTHVRSTRRALALDLHGFGASAPSSAGDYSMVALAADVAAVVDARGLDRFVLVGHSLGGLVAVAYGGLHPDRVAGLLLVDAAPDLHGTPPDELQQFVANFSAEKHAEFSAGFYSEMLVHGTSGTRDTVLAMLRATPREIFVAAFTGMFAFDPASALARHAGPKLALVTASHDGPTSLHRLGAGFEHQVVPAVSHWLMLDDPDGFAARLDAFIAGIAGSAP